LRQQKALEKADITVSKLEKKVADSKARGRKVQARRKGWEELNGEVAAPVGKLGGGGVERTEGQLEEGIEGVEEEEERGEELPIRTVDDGEAAAVTEAGPEPVEAAKAAEDEDDVVL
jgi:hypothetical protein